MKDFEDLLSDLRDAHEKAVDDAIAECESTPSQSELDAKRDAEDANSRLANLISAAEYAAIAMEAAGISPLCGSDLFLLRQAIKDAQA